MLHALPPASLATLTGKTFFPGLISGPFKHGLMFAFSFSAALYLLAAAASWRGSMARPASLPGLGRPELTTTR